MAIFPRDVNKLQLPLPLSSRYLPLIYFRVRTAVHPQLNGNQDVPVISRVSIQPEAREIFSLPPSNVAESHLCSCKRGRRWPWANKSNGPAETKPLPVLQVEISGLANCARPPKVIRIFACIHAFIIGDRGFRFSLSTRKTAARIICFVLLLDEDEARSIIGFVNKQCDFDERAKITCFIFESRIKDDIKREIYELF